MIAGERAELQERMKRSPSAPGGVSPSRERARRSWWMEGTAEYQVAPWVATWGQKPRGSKRAGTTTVPPERKVERAEAIKPWTWKRGITQRETSPALRA